MKLNEVLDKPLDWKWKNKGTLAYWTTFWSDIKNPRPETAFSVEIELDDEIDMWVIRFGDGAGRMGITKGGNEFKIFATVMDIVKSFVKLAKPGGIYFAAKEGSRAKLYKKIISKFAPNIGYKLDHSDKDPEGVTGFALRKR